MKLTPNLMCLLGLLLVVELASGCMVRPRATIIEPEPVVVVESAPSTVYYDGVTLHYYDGYYRYRRAGSWVVARRVPAHVSHYHRPPRSRAVHRSRTVHRSRSARPAPRRGRTVHRTRSRQGRVIRRR